MGKIPLGNLSRHSTNSYLLAIQGLTGSNPSGELRHIYSELFPGQYNLSISDCVFLRYCDSFASGCAFYEAMGARGVTVASRIRRSVRAF